VDSRLALARRLKALREERWPRRAITQGQLAEALSTRKPLSVASISSWESTTAPKPPPVHRLEAYATFFATERSVAKEPYQLIDLSQLTEFEQTTRDRLLTELTRLRTAATGAGPVEAGEEADRGLWHFPDNEPVTIVCAQLPPDLLANVPYADPNNPDYVRLYTFADPDALLELYGHVRALNPATDVSFRIASELGSDEYPATHLISLGGVDWNIVTSDLMTRLDLPVRQDTRPQHSNAGYFEVTEGGETKKFEPELRKTANGNLLVEDVAHFYRGPSPYNRELTVTICNGMFGRGTLGAVRALTDAQFRDKNERYVQKRFADRETISILTRVSVVKGRVVAPDWTDPDVRLHEWSEDPL
jgi:hypothetical protein